MNDEEYVRMMGKFFGELEEWLGQHLEYEIEDIAHDTFIVKHKQSGELFQIAIIPYYEAEDED